MPYRRTGTTLHRSPVLVRCTVQSMMWWRSPFTVVPVTYKFKKSTVSGRSRIRSYHAVEGSVSSSKALQSKSNDHGGDDRCFRNKSVEFTSVKRRVEAGLIMREKSIRWWNHGGEDSRF